MSICKRRWLQAGWLMAALTLAQAAGADGPKVALVIGNSNYGSNSISGEQDALTIAAYLTEMGFDVIGGKELVLGNKPLHNATAEAIRAGLAELAKRAPAAKTVVVFYSGHGFQIDGENFLVPVEPLTISERTLLPEQPIPMFEVLNALSFAREEAGKLVILDACRKNASLPVGDTQLGQIRGWSEGLANSEEIHRDVAFLFAAAPGDTVPANAPDKLSTFSATLVKSIREPGLEIRSLVTRLRQGLENKPTDENFGALPPGEFFLSEPMYIETQIEDADDDLTVLLNGEKVLSWGVDRKRSQPLRLKAGPNELRLCAYNDRTQVDKKAWERTEGWHYEMAVTRRDGVQLTPCFQGNLPCFKAREEIPFKDGPHWSTEPFLAARVVLNVDPEHPGTIMWGEREPDLWNSEADFYARDQDSLWERNLTQLAGGQVLASLISLGGVDPAQQFIAVRGNVQLRPAVERCMQGKDLVHELLSDLQEGSDLLTLLQSLSDGSVVRKLLQAIQGFDGRLSQCVASNFNAPGNSLVKVWTSIEDRQHHPLEAVTPPPPSTNRGTQVPHNVCSSVRN